MHITSLSRSIIIEQKDLQIDIYDHNLVATRRRDIYYLLLSSEILKVLSNLDILFGAQYVSGDQCLDLYQKEGKTMITSNERPKKPG